jgi:hypothetical protein
MRTRINILTILLLTVMIAAACGSEGKKKPSPAMVTVQLKWVHRRSSRDFMLPKNTVFMPKKTLMLLSCLAALG